MLQTSTDIACALGENTRFVEVRFRVKHRGLVPLALENRQRVTKVKKGPPSETTSGTIVIEPTQRVELNDFFRIERHGYVITDGYWYRVQADQRSYFIVVFRFERGDSRYPADRQLYEKLWPALYDMYEEGFWRVRAFRNPFYTEGVLVPDACSLSFDFDSRTPRYDVDGEPIVERPKDQSGKKLEDQAPLPIQPDNRLLIVDDSVEIWPAT